MIGWRKAAQKFFNQYNNPTLNRMGRIGFPENSTLGFRLGMRVQNQRLGQIAIWPIAPGEDGLYICEAARIVDEMGSTTYERKSFAVTVSK